MSLKIDSITGNISQIECVGPFYRKNFTIFNQGGPDIVLDLYLETDGNFRLYGATGATLTVGINSDEYFSFAIEYENTIDGTGATLTSDNTIYNGYIVPEILISPSKPLLFKANNPQYPGKREIGSLVLLDEDSSPVVSLIDRNFTKDTSFGLARTNPKLTGNVKITVDSSQNIWLNSIDAEKELSDDKFKKYRVSPDSSYAIDLKRFFDGGTTPVELVFSLYQDDSQYTSTKRDFSFQYDKFYQYGVESLSSKFYDEDFSFFAPLCLKSDIPDYFVIFRTEGPINEFSYDPNSRFSDTFISEILKKSSIVKTFSLKETSSIGRYLRNIVNHPARKSSDMTISFQTDGYTSFNGISYREGSFAQKGELLYDYFQQENPILSVEEFLTQGFQRNGIISSSIINLEFLFDDQEAEQYSINRYFGLYVNSIDLAKFELDENGLVQYSSQLGQFPFPRKGVDATKTSLKSFTQRNENGIKLYVNTHSVTSKISPKSFTSVVSSISLTGATYSINLPGNLENKIFSGQGCTLTSPGGLFIGATVEQVSYQDNITTILTETPLGLFSSSKSINFYDEEKFNEFKLDIFDNRFIDDARLFYLKDRNDVFHSIKSTRQVDVSVDSFTVEKMIEISLHEKVTDISNFTGFLDIITQTPAVLLNKGKASMEVKVHSYFSPNDFIEIKWDNGPSTGGYPLRWKVIANTTSLSPGQSWPSYSIGTDSEGEFYFTYFHPGDSTINIDVLVKSIREAFERFPYKNFEVLAKEQFLFFRSKEQGLASEKTILNFGLDSSVISVMGIAAPLSGSVNFIGASDRNKTRARIDKDVANGMLIDEYISTEGNFSRIKQFNIFDQVIISAPYLEEPVYDETGEYLVDFVGSEKYHTVVLDNESQPIQLTYDKKLTSYELFRPSYGILSILPFRDFDTDLHLSDYAKSYTPELFEYFWNNIQPLAISATAPGDIVIFDREVSFDSEIDTFTGQYLVPVYSPFLVLSDGSVPSELVSQSQFKFEEPGYTATLVGYTVNIGDSVLLLPGKKSLYYTEDELSKFKGFLSLSSIVTAENEQQFQIYENLWDPRRFVFQNLNSEYDRLAENYLKTLCLKSRVVPNICKWVQNERDIRENPYRFNLSRAFGVMNFSPFEQISADPKFHTHEWPYLDRIPESLNYQADSFAYMFEPLSDKYDFSSTTIDYFSLYFNTGYPTEQFKYDQNYSSVDVKSMQKYSVFRYEDFSGKTFTMFRGKKIEISNAKKYDGYRFSTIIKTVHSNFLLSEDPISYNTIVNEKWKFIVVIITVRVSTYRFPSGNFSYTDLYTLENCNTVCQRLGASVYEATLPNDYKLSDPMNFNTYSTNPTVIPNTFYFDSYLTSDTFLESLQEELVEDPESGNFNRLCACSNFSPGINVSLPKPVSNAVFDTYLRLTDLGGIILKNIKYEFTTLSILSSIPDSLDWQNFTVYHEGGGNGAYLGLRDRLSFFEISNVMSGKSDKSVMIFDVYKTDGVYSNEPDFSFSFVSPEALIRQKDFIPVPDTDKPPVFLTYGDIGAVLNETNNLQTIYRYQGNFSPKFRDVLTFWLREDDDFTSTSQTDFMMCNTHFAYNTYSFSLLKNQYYNKVSESEILSISPNDGYSPVYPLVNEVSIDRKDINAWSSNWDQSYYRKYTSTAEYDEVRGTDGMKEIKSLFGSKSMKVPKWFDLYKFTTEQYTEGFDLASTNKELSYIDKGNSCVIRVNVYERLLREMFGDDTDLRAQTEFLKTQSIIPDSFAPEEISNKVREYLEKNILNLYEIGNVKMFILQTGNSDEGQISTTSSSIIRPVIETTAVDINGTVENVSLDENSLFLKNYLVKKDVKITSVGNMVFEIEYPFDSRFFTSISLGVSVKRI